MILLGGRDTDHVTFSFNKYVTEYTVYSLIQAKDEVIKM